VHLPLISVRLPANAGLGLNRCRFGDIGVSEVRNSLFDESKYQEEKGHFFLLCPLLPNPPRKQGSERTRKGERRSAANRTALIIYRELTAKRL
jgi:hypothetical protein